MTAWSALKKGASEPTPPHPTPIVPARPATPEEITSSPRSLLKVAAAHDWATTTTYAHGTSAHADGHPAGEVERLLVRGRHADGRRFVAAWDTSTTTDDETGETSTKTKFRLAYRWLVAAAGPRMHPESIGARPLTNYLKAAPVVDLPTAEEVAA